MNKTYAKRTTAQLGNHGVPLRCIIENEMGFSGLGKCMLVYAGRTVREMSRSSKTNPMYACTDGGRKWTQGARLCNGIRQNGYDVPSGETRNRKHSAKYLDK